MICFCVKIKAMKKFLLVPALFLLFLIFPKISFAKTDCHMLPGNIQCFRSWCDSGQTLVCQSNTFCYCYKEGETIEEGICKGKKAASGGNCSSLGSEPINVDPTTGCPGYAINSAIGCIPISDTNAFVSFILRWAIGIGGGIAFLLILYSGFMIMTSQGNPERLKAGQELLTSALAGLIMLIFSVFILRIIGVDILGIIPKG
jgi:hypothetical protein